MGGTIAVTVRKTDGAIHKFSAWTNRMPFITNTPNILDENNPEFLAFIDDCEKADPNEFFWAGHQQSAPEEYGLIVIDYQTNHILQFDKYYTIGQIYWASLENAINAFDHQDEGDDNEAINHIKLAALGRVKHIMVWNPGKQDYDYHDVTEMNGPKAAESLKQALEKACAGNFNFRVEYDLSPFTVIKFTDHNELKNKMLELGFIFDAAEEQTWTNYGKFEEDDPV